MSKVHDIEEAKRIIRGFSEQLDEENEKIYSEEEIKSIAEKIANIPAEREYKQRMQQYRKNMMNFGFNRVNIGKESNSEEKE